MVKYEKKPLKAVIAEAEQGSKESRLALGLLTELGLVGENMNFAEALSWYESAAEQGEYLAALSAASIYQDGAPGIPADPSKAEKFFELAKKAGFDKPENRIQSHTGTIVGKRVLIVDEDNSQRGQMERELISNGFKPMSVPNLEGVQTAFLNHPDIHCIFVEITLSKNNPVEILNGIRKIRAAKSIPMVVVTTVTDVEVIKQAKKFDINGWILKPVKNDLVGKAAKRLA